MPDCCRYIITGKVQGVFFRASTQQQAMALGLSGYAQNLANGSVEVVVCGEQKALEQMQHWLKIGPKMASVDAVKQLDCVAAQYPGFEIRS